MALSYTFVLERADDLEPALAVIERAPAWINGAFSTTSKRLSGRGYEDLSEETGFPTAARISARVVNSRSVEATEGILQASLAAAHAIRGASALYFEFDARIFRRLNGTLECYPASGYWPPERVALVAAAQPTFVLSDKDYPPDQHIALACNNAGKESYVIERLDGTTVVETEPPTLNGRTLHVHYERRNTTMTDSVANLLIFVKILRELLQDAFRGRADQVTFHAQPSGATANLPYF